MSEPWPRCASGSPKKPAKPDGRDPGIEALERAAEDFGADIDAEGRLQPGTFRRDLRAGQGPVQTLLVGAFGRILQNGIDHLILRGRDRFLMRHDGPGPFRRDLGRMCEQRLLPDEADRQQIGQRVIAFTAFLRIPKSPARVL